MWKLLDRSKQVGFTGVIKNTNFLLVLVFIGEFPGMDLLIIAMGKVKNLKIPGFFRKSMASQQPFPCLSFSWVSPILHRSYVFTYQISLPLAATAAAVFKPGKVLSM